MGDKLKKQKKEMRELRVEGLYKMVSPREGHIKIRLVGKKDGNIASWVTKSWYKDERKTEFHNCFRVQKAVSVVNYLGDVDVLLFCEGYRDIA